MISTPKSDTYTRQRLVVLVILRVAIGWHLMYEGLSKLFQPNWTSMAYLLDSKGLLAWVFHSIAMNPTLLRITDMINAWGLTIIGFMLILGLRTKLAKLGAMAFLLLFYLAQPPLLDVQYMLPSEGSYLWVNKNLIELLALLVLYFFPTGHIVGVDRLLGKRIYNQR